MQKPRVNVTPQQPTARLVVQGGVPSDASGGGFRQETVMANEQVTEVQTTVVRDMVVDVPEKHVMTIKNRIPQFEQVVEEEEHVVKERVTIERLDIQGNSVVEQTETDVPVVTTRYQKNCVFVETPGRDHTVKEVDVPVASPQTTGTTFTVDPSVDVNVLTLQDPSLTVNYETEMVPTVIKVPNVNVVRGKEETEVFTGKTVINAIERIERIREVPQTHEIKETVEIPSMNTIHETRHVVKVVDDGSSRGVVTDPDAQTRAEMYGARVECQLLRQQVKEMEEQLIALQQKKLEVRTAEQQAQQNLAVKTERLKVMQLSSPVVVLSPVRRSDRAI